MIQRGRGRTILALRAITGLINKAGRGGGKEGTAAMGNNNAARNNLLRVEGGCMRREVAYKFRRESGCHYGGC